MPAPVTLQTETIKYIKVFYVQFNNGAITIGPLPDEATANLVGDSLRRAGTMGYSRWSYMEVDADWNRASHLKKVEATMALVEPFLALPTETVATVMKLVLQASGKTVLPQGAFRIDE